MTYEVGYKRPPKKNQFQKGKSPNPKGRPPASVRVNGGSVDLIKTSDKALRRKVEINERGVKRKIPILEAAINKQIQKALVDGDPKALAQVFRLAEKVYQAVLDGRTEKPLRIIVTGGLPGD